MVDTQTEALETLTGAVMTYKEYVVAYESLLWTFLSYTGTQVGSGVYASKLSDLEDANPQHAIRYDIQEEQT